MQKYDHGNPTDAEQYMLELLNRARADPLKEAMRLGIDLQDGTKKDPQGNPIKPILDTPVAPLPFNSKLMQAAGDFAQWLADTGGTPLHPHIGKDGSDVKGRITDAGYDAILNGLLAAEIIAHDFGATTSGATFAHEGLFLDLSDDDAGHRRYMLQDWDEVGIGGRGNQAVEDFVLNWLAGPKSPNPTVPRPKFILGVVYVGSKGDAYAMGKGLQGVTVMPSQGDRFAITSASGGYAIPMDKLSGPTTVTFEHKGMVKTQTVELGDQSVKVDCYFPGFHYLYVIWTPLDFVVKFADRFWSWFKSWSSRAVNYLLRFIGFPK
jgi:hypothetical protein